MKDRTPVWDYALHSGGLSAVRYTAVSFFFEDTDVSVFSLLCVVPSELDGDITEPLNSIPVLQGQSIFELLMQMCVWMSLNRPL